MGNRSGKVHTKINMTQFKCNYNQYSTMKKDNIFIFPIQNKVILPYSQYRFSLSTNRFNPQTYDNLVGFVSKIQDVKQNKNIQKIDGFSRYGTLLKINKSDIAAGYSIFQRTKIFNVNYFGLTFARFKILSLSKNDNNYIANIQIYPDEITKEIQQFIQKNKLMQNLKKELILFYDCKLRKNEAEYMKQKLQKQQSINKILFQTVDTLQISYVQKIKFIQINKHIERFNFILNLLSQKTEGLKGINSIQDKVRQELINKRKVTPPPFSQSFLGNNTKDKELAQKIQSLPLHVRQQAQKQYRNMGSGTQRSMAIKYIQTLLQIPWQKSTEDVKDITIAEKILHNDHTGLKDVKQRILQYLAVKFRNGNSKGNIICLHGPPGVGKTSIAKSIARSLGKQFTRISLGGMSDESQLRGHRRTYVGSLPGTIIKALIKAKSNNPVILLDEIQKLGNSYKGNPQHALLQILDPSQNSSFVDHYVSIPVDLSKVMFICTANSLDLSGPLLNRLQIINVPGYSRQQKIQIAKNHLIPLQLKQNGVVDILQFQNSGIKQIVTYSDELGVRNLQRNISKICRKVARKGVKQIITKQKVQQFLKKRHKQQLWGGIGIVNGMAWTPMGGKVLIVQAIKYQSSKPKIQITGQLGDVMKQSVNIAFSWIKANLQQLVSSNIMGSKHINVYQKIKQIQQLSLHIHFPEGATKKDGPSAGVTIVTCISSLLLKSPVRQNLSMTGEITLSGKVLPVGGIRQKCMAAIYQGIKHIIIPYGNIKDIQKIDADLKKDIQFYPVKDIRQVLAAAFPHLIQKNQAPKL